MKPLTRSQGESDPVTYTCTCSAGENGGSVLLFYRYWTNHPRLPGEYSSNASSPDELAEWHRKMMAKFSLGGKTRIAKEGYNITVAGTKEGIASYIHECCFHWSFAGLDLDNVEARNAFFKPSDGCACVFGQISSIRIAAEITPMIVAESEESSTSSSDSNATRGVEGYIPSNWNIIESLSPAEFHKRCYEDNIYLIDVRNHYESKIGYFVSPQSGQPALKPQIRRFSQWPQWVKQRMLPILGEADGGQRQIMTYCTGGIRCEKAVRWMQETTSESIGAKSSTLKGGIAAYLTWMDEEIKAGRKKPEDSLFKGRNYVFDARGSTGLSEETEPVAKCHVCLKPSDRLSKCQSKGCHLVLVVCLGCEKEDHRCCQNCRDMDGELSDAKPGLKLMCACETSREWQLWGGERIKAPRKSRSKRTQYKELGSGEKSDVRIKVIE